MIKEKCNYAGITDSDSNKLEVIIVRRIIHFLFGVKGKPLIPLPQEKGQNN